MKKKKRKKKTCTRSFRSGAGGSVTGSQIYIFFETRSHYVAQIGLEREILMLQTLESWDYRHAPTYTFHTIY
jgi:hypothetical protein